GEGDFRRTNGEASAVLELQSFHPLALDLDAVRRVEVNDPVGGALLPQFGMSAGDIGIGDLDVGVLRAPDHLAALRDLVPLSVPGEDGELALDAELDRRGGLRRLQDGLARLVD